MIGFRIFKGALPLVMAAGFANAAFAGGLERGGYDIDLLFDKSRYAFEAGVTYVMPDRKLTNAQDVDPRTGRILNRRSSSVRDTDNYAVPYFGVKIGLTDDVDCLADYSEPFGAHSNPGSNWAGANYDVETKLRTHNYGLTCSYKFDAGPGDLRLIGGGFYQEVVGFKEQLVLPAGTPLGGGIVNPTDRMGTLDVDDQGWGWRAGVAYEIPEYAFRTSLVYNSRVKYNNIDGTVDLTSVPAGLGFPYGRVTPVSGSATAPDSLELKLQTGIAPDWLAFGSVKWTNWSLIQSVPFCPTSVRGCAPGSRSVLTSLDLLYRDGWTLTGGVGHKFNDKWSGAVSLTWDRGTASQDYGIASDTWTLGAGVSYKPVEHVEFRFAGAVGLLTSGHSGTVTSNGVTYGDDVTYRYGNDFVGALSTSVKVTF
jgi:long-chain fatty acid transport protein